MIDELSMSSGLIDAIARFFDRLLPAKLTDDDVDAPMRARLLLAGSLGLLFFHSLILLDFLTLEVRSPVTQAAMFVGSGLYLAIPFVLRATGSAKIAGLFTTGALLVVAGFLSYDNGGFNLSLLPWFAAVPLVAVFFVGTQAGAVATFAVVFELLAFYALDQHGYPFPEPADPETLDWYALLSGITATLFMGGLAGLYERSRRQANSLALLRHKELEAANERIRIAWDQARAGSDAKSEFIANISHELRTPMNGVIGMAGLMLDTRLSTEQRDYAETIISSAQSLLLLINELLDTAKLEAGKLELRLAEFDLHQCIEDAMGLLVERAHQKELELSYLIAPDVYTWVEGDRVRLRQVITNLVHNAIKFTDRGEVSLRVDLARPQDPSSPIRFEVRDTGIGMTDEVRSRLFEPFMQADTSMTRRYGGTGLGLAIAKNLVELMGGEIGVETKPGEGSTFWFTVQFANQWSSRGDDSVSLLQALFGRRALVVDDNATMREMISRELHSLGVVAETASGGYEALHLLEVSARRGEPHHLAIVDVLMPDLDGIEVVRAMKLNPLLARIPVIVLSPLSRAARRKEALALGAASYLAKPPRRLQLADRIAAALEPGVGEQQDEVIAAGGGASPLHQKRRVLLVEDNEVSARVGVRQLRKLGYEADAASGGVEAVAMIARAEYDVVLMDCQMPDLDGFEATRQIRRAEGESRRTIIIAMTAAAMAGDREKCLRAGMDDFLTKPVRFEDLRETLFQWCTRGTAPPPAAAPPRRGDPAENLSVDLGAIQKLRALVSQDEPDLVNELIEIFLRDARASCDELQAAARRRDVRTIEYQAHKLVSGCGNLGARRMARLCRELEEEAKRNTGEEAAPLVEHIARIESEFAIVCKTFAEHPIV